MHERLTAAPLTSRTESTILLVIQVNYNDKKG